MCRSALLPADSPPLWQNNITYSYNVFVMLDQLKNIDDPDMMLAPSEYMVNHAAVNRLSASLGC